MPKYSNYRFHNLVNLNQNYVTDAAEHQGNFAVSNIIDMATNHNTSVYIPLESVESEHCALIVDKGLSKVPGIISHKVELNNKRAIIDTNDAMDVLPKSVKVIRYLGYNVEPRAIKLSKFTIAR
jgi:copper chaperone CopZ